jgi:hypothetical protein
MTDPLTKDEDYNINIIQDQNRQIVLGEDKQRFKSRHSWDPRH